MCIICTVIQWLISTSIFLFPNDRYINISCSLTESTPVAKCLATLNCSKCDEVTTEVFTSHTLLPVTVGSDYHISVQAVRPDNNAPLEEYNTVETLSVPAAELSLQPIPTLSTKVHPLSTVHPQLTLQPQPPQHPNSGKTCKLVTLSCRLN